MCELVLSQHGRGGQYFIADEALVPRRGCAGVRPRVRLELCPAARALPAVGALQRHGAVLPAPVLAGGPGGGRGRLRAPGARRTVAVRAVARVVVFYSFRPRAFAV